MTLTFEDPVSRDRRGINRAVCSPGYAVLQFTMSDFLKAWHIELNFAEFTESGQAESTAGSMQVNTIRLHDAKTSNILLIMAITVTSIPMRMTTMVF